MADEQITLEQFKDVCSRMFPDVSVEKAMSRKPFPDKVIYDCIVDDTLQLRFCFADKYMDNHVVVLGYESPRSSPSWDVYVYSKEDLLLELEAIVEARLKRETTNKQNKSKMKSNKENWTRHTIIDSEMVGKCYSVYNGSRFVPVTPRKRDIGKTLLSVALQKEE